MNQRTAILFAIDTIVGLEPHASQCSYAAIGECDCKVPAMLLRLRHAVRSLPTATVTAAATPASRPENSDTSGLPEQGGGA